MITVTSTYDTPATLIELLQAHYPMLVSDLELLIASSNILFVPGPYDSVAGVRTTVGKYESEIARDQFLAAVDLLFTNRYSITYAEALTAMNVIETNTTSIV